MPPVLLRPTEPFPDQKPGTSGLRKKTTVFQQKNYIENFAQATFNALVTTGTGIPSVLLLGGDGRFLGKEACQKISEVAAGNGVKRIWIGQDGLLSTPAVSSIIRNREGGFVAQGAFIATASHNPGGPNADFGLKYNGSNGGPAPEKLTNVIFEESTKLKELKVCELPPIDLSKIGVVHFDDVTVEIIDSTEDYVAQQKQIFDMNRLKAFFARKDFTFVFDAMHGIAGPYANKIFVELLGAPPEAIRNSVPKEDFAGGHPDPNLTYASDLVKTMGLTRTGTVLEGVDPATVPQFGAAADGDADRNMILGKCFFVSPSDSVAIISANCKCIPFFAQGLKAICRSMPTSGALDRVAQELNIPLMEVPTGWKFFSNLMDSKDVFNGKDYNPLICGEESFGTGSNHVREKDGLWAVLAWLSILADANPDDTKPLVTVQDIVINHWKKFGRNFYCRYDYENVDAKGANAMMDHLRAITADKVPNLGDVPCALVDDFEYHDPVDGSVSMNQGIRVVFKDGSRFVVRLSGTGSAGATIRLYLEKYVAPHLVDSIGLQPTATVLKELIEIALVVSDLKKFSGRDEPTVIT